MYGYLSHAMRTRWTVHWAAFVALTTLFFLTKAEASNANATLFYLDENGVTIKCPDAPVGSRGIVDGVEYTKRSEEQIRRLRDEQDQWPLLETTCTSGIESLVFMFDRISFNQNVASWDTSNVTDMGWMLSRNKDFNQPIGDWDTSKVTDMSGMFHDTGDFNQPIGKWNTSKVNNMYAMFSRARAFNQSIEEWDTSNVRDMKEMFLCIGYCAFNQPIGKWNTTNVLNMSSMFNYNTRFNQPIGDWDTSNVLDMSGMFGTAYSFNQPIGE